MLKWDPGNSPIPGSLRVTNRPASLFYASDHRNFVNRAETCTWSGCPRRFRCVPSLFLLWKTDRASYAQYLGQLQ